MHLPHADTHSKPSLTDYRPEQFSLDFLWLELTNRCNLHCVHCYTESHPNSGDRDVLTRKDYLRLMQEAYELGCRKIQFIGGEPQLNAHFHELMVSAKTMGFDYIEVYSNLTRLEDRTLNFASEHGICFATSVYSAEPAAHDAITKVRSSHARTVTNLERLIGRGVETRAAIIIIDQDRPALERASSFLRELGVKHVTPGVTREFGRGEAIVGERARLSGLCGHCWAGKLCVAPDGAAFPCVMARQWPVGNVLETSLAQIVRGQAMRHMRREIFEEVWLPRTEAFRLASESPCPPENPTCGPDTGAPDCAPELNPTPQTDPEAEPGKYPSDDPNVQCFPCPQSCSPDFEVPPCNPSPCPKSCGPFPTVKEE